MLNMCWEGRTVNQPIIAWCPRMKAKGQKVHEKSNFCCNSPSVMCTSLPSLACVSVCSWQRQAFLCVCMETQRLLYPATFWVWVMHFAPFFHQSASPGRAVTLHCCEAGVGQSASDPREHFWTAWGSGLLPSGWVPKPNWAMQVLLHFFHLRLGLLGKEFPFIYFKPGFRTYHLE